MQARDMEKFAGNSAAVAPPLPARTTAPHDDVGALVAGIVSRARGAQVAFAQCTQEEIDNACLAIAKPVFCAATNRRLCEMAVASTGIGNVADKMRKNTRKTLGLLRDIRGQKSIGVIHQSEADGITTIARPLGVVAALTPSTNPIATPINKTINALKGGNAVVLVPPPAAADITRQLLALFHAELDRIGIPAAADLVQAVLPPSKPATAAIMQQADFVLVTGSQRNVRAAYSSGTPAIGVGAGNVAVIIDETADVNDAAAKIAASKTFDNATSCSSENHLVIVDAVYEQTLAALQACGGVLLTAAQKQQLQKNLWTDNGALNRQLIAKDLPVMTAQARLAGIPPAARFLLVEETQVGTHAPFSGEKLSLVLTVYRAATYEAAAARANDLLAHQGGGHSLGIHTRTDDRPLQLGLTAPACRVIVNQAHCFANGGSFDNALPFSLSMGCGSWGGNSISDNLNFRHLTNTVRVVRAIPERKPAVADIYADYPGDTSDLNE